MRSESHVIVDLNNLRFIVRSGENQYIPPKTLLIVMVSVHNIHV